MSVSVSINGRSSCGFGNGNGGKLTLGNRAKGNDENGQDVEPINLAHCAWSQWAAAKAIGADFRDRV